MTERDYKDTKAGLIIISAAIIYKFGGIYLILSLG